jgi:hypothetical protein
LIRDAGAVDKKSEKYKKFHMKYVQRCKKLIVSLSIYTNKVPAVLNNSNPSNNQNISTNSPINESLNKDKIIQ